MTLNGKRDGFVMEDFRAVAKSAMMKRGRAEAILKAVASVVAKWPDFAAEARVDEGVREKIQTTHCLTFPGT
jgi:serine/threonine-protein kinase HipA